MKPSDLTPNKIEEAPQGALSKFGNYLGSKLSTFAPDLAQRSTGKLNTGAVANKAWSGFQQYLGQTGEKPTTANVILWLQHNKYSPEAIKAAENVLRTSASTARKTAQAKAAKDNPTLSVQKPQPPTMQKIQPAPAGGAGGAGGALANPPPDDVTESKKPAHHLDLMRNYLDILRENDEAVVEAVAKADITSQIASQAIMAAAQAQAKSQYTQPQAAPAAATTPAAAPAAAPAAVSNTGAGAAAAQAGILRGVGGGGGGGGNTATTGAASVAPTGGTKSATDPHTMAQELYAILDSQSKSGDQRAQRLNTALNAYIQSAPPEGMGYGSPETASDRNWAKASPELKAAAESLNFSESFNPGKMLQKKVTKLTRIK